MSYEFDVFLSHSSKDDKTVNELANRLSEDGVKVWVDDQQILPGIPIVSCIQQALEKSRKVLYFLSQNSVRSDWTLAELLDNLLADPLNRSGRFLLVRLDDVKIPPLLAQFRYIDWRTPDDDKYQRLRRACLHNPLTRSQRWIMRGHTGAVCSVAVTRDGSLAVSGSEDNSVRIWNLKSGTCTDVLEGHRDTVNSVAVTSDGRLAVSGSGDKTVRVWDLESKQCIRILDGHSSAVTSVALTSDGISAVSGTDDGTIRVWKLDLREPIAIHEGGSGSIYSLAITQNGQRILAGTARDTLRVWDVGPTGSISDNEGKGFIIRGVAMTADGDLAASCSLNRDIRVWSLNNGAWIGNLSGHEDWVSAVAITPDGRRIVSSSADKTLRIWDPDTTDCIEILQGHDEHVTGVAVTLDGRCLVSSSHDKTVRVWDVPEIPKPIVVPFDSGIDLHIPKCSPRNLFWGRAIYHPGALLRYHTHPVDEIIIVLKGRLPVKVEGRHYELGPLDIIYIPRSLDNRRTAHLSWNTTDQNVSFLWALSGNELSRRFLDEKEIPAECKGLSKNDGNEDLPEFAEFFRQVAGREDSLGCSIREYFKQRNSTICLGHARLNPGCSTPLMHHECEACLMVLSGHVDVQLEQTRELRMYDTLIIPSGVPYQVANPTATVSEFIWAYTEDK